MAVQHDFYNEALFASVEMTDTGRVDISVLPIVPFVCFVCMMGLLEPQAGDS